MQRPSVQRPPARSKMLLPDLTMPGAECAKAGLWSEEMWKGIERAAIRGGIRPTSSSLPGRSLVVDARAARKRLQTDDQLKRDHPTAVLAWACPPAARIAPTANQVGQFAAAPVVLPAKSGGRRAIGLSSIHSPSTARRSRNRSFFLTKCLTRSGAP